MNPQDPLANLHPLRQPEIIGWWPPAPGWWALLLLVLLALATLVYLLHRRYRRNAYRRRALLQLQGLRNTYQSNHDTSHYLGQVNALLKSVALLTYPGNDIAAQHGEAWRTFLNRSLPPGEQLQTDFDDAAYRKHAPDIDVDRLHTAAQHWIKRHRVQR